MMLRVVLPKGSLERATLELFEQADLPVLRSSSVQYLASIDDPRVSEVRILRPQEIATYVAEGMFDIGITGRDWIEESEADVVSLGELRYSKATSRPIRLVLAVAQDSPWQTATDLPSGVRVSTEYLGATERFFSGLGVKANVRLSYGATEAKVPDIADAVVEITETGSALRAAGLRIIDTVLTSYTELIANKSAYEDPDKRKAMLQLKTLLDGVMEARGKVLLKLNVAPAQFEAVLALVPSMGQPTVSQLAGDAGFAIETVVLKNKINTLIPDLVEAGATAILEIPISKIVP
jgi:ATP phosphoribosyltransferase